MKAYISYSLNGQNKKLNTLTLNVRHDVAWFDLLRQLFREK